MLASPIHLERMTARTQAGLFSWWWTVQFKFKEEASYECCWKSQFSFGSASESLKCAGPGRKGLISDTYITHTYSYILCHRSFCNTATLE